MLTHLLSLRSAVASGDAASIFTAAHDCALGICDNLEAAADALPNRLNTLWSRNLAMTILPVLRECHRHEEVCLEKAGITRIGRWIEPLHRLRLEHRRDQYYAEEIGEALLEISDTRPPGNPEALGFMLRGFIEAQTRHVASEQELVLPALGFGTRL